MIETRQIKIVTTTYSKKNNSALKFLVILPKLWTDELNLTPENKMVSIKYISNTIVIKKDEGTSLEKSELRYINLYFNKSQKGNLTARLTLPKQWCLDMGFNSEDRAAYITIYNDTIILSKNIDNKL